jgi:putative DNA primase/helicase
MTIENAQQIWDNAKLADDSHPFFGLWQVRRPGLRVDRSGALLIVPMRDAVRNLQNLAYINSKGSSRYLWADNIPGLYYGLTGRKEVIAIAKEFVTGVRYHELTGNAVAVAFCAENVPHVAKAMLEKYPTTRVFLIEDLDVGMKNTPAVASAEAAAAIVNQPVALPEFDRGNALKPGSDAQKLLDWIRRKGLTEFTRKQVMQLGPSSIRDATSAKAALRTLVEKGLIITEDGSGYRVTPAALLSFAEERQDSA